jgi:hypothetical protein
MMRTTFIRFSIAIALAAGGWLSWAEARLADRVADIKEQVATLRFEDVRALPERAGWSGYFPGVRSLEDDVRVEAASVAYWLGRYQDVNANTDNAEADAAVLLTAANAAFRQSQRDPGTGQAAVQQLDSVLNAYSSALKASARHVEAAYNYEFVARLRDQVARSQGKPSRTTGAPVVAERTGDLPSGATIHGRPGAPPPEAKMEDLQMLAPMEYGDREAQPEATPGGKRERKG